MRMANARRVIAIVLAVLVGASIATILSRTETLSDTVTSIGKVAMQQQQQRQPASRVRDSYALDTRSLINEIKTLEEYASKQFHRQGLTFDWYVATSGNGEGDGELHYAVHRSKIQPPSIRIAIVAGMHAREPFSSELVRLWMGFAALYSNDRPDDVEWVYVPVLNPCGRDRVAVAYRNGGTSWDLCKRTNCKRVDLNRNWISTTEQIYDTPLDPADTRWRRKRWNGRPEENPGHEAFSEPETRALGSILGRFKPDLLLSLHTGAAEVLVPPEGAERIAPLPGRLASVGAWLARQGCPMPDRNASATRACRSGAAAKLLRYTAEGTLVDYALFRASVPAAFTLEVYDSGQDGGQYGPSPPEYDGEEHWGSNPMDCFSFFNPPAKQVLQTALSWTRMWRTLYYMNGTEGDELRLALNDLKENAKKKGSNFAHDD